MPRRVSCDSAARALIASAVFKVFSREFRPRYEQRADSTGDRRNIVRQRTHRWITLTILALSKLFGKLRGLRDDFVTTVMGLEHKRSSLVAWNAVPISSEIVGRVRSRSGHGKVTQLPLPGVSCPPVSLHLAVTVVRTPSNVPPQPEDRTRSAPFVGARVRPHFGSRYWPRRARSGVRAKHRARPLRPTAACSRPSPHGMRPSHGAPIASICRPASTHGISITTRATSRRRCSTSCTDSTTAGSAASGSRAARCSPIRSASFHSSFMGDCCGGRSRSTSRSI